MSCENCANAYDEGYTAGHNAENARLRGDLDTALGLRRMESRRVDAATKQAEALAGALTRIAEGDAESYLSCPGVPICSRTHDDNCGVGIARAVLRAYREATS